MSIRKILLRFGKAGSIPRTVGDIYHQINNENALSENRENIIKLAKLVTTKRYTDHYDDKRLAPIYLQKVTDWLNRSEDYTFKLSDLCTYMLFTETTLFPTDKSYKEFSDIAEEELKAKGVPNFWI